MIKKILIGAVGACAVAAIGLFGWFLIVTQDLPSAKELANYEPPITSRVHAGDGRLVAEFASQHRVYVPSEELPDQLINAFVSAEDKTFFEHSGVNLVAMMRGTVWNALRGRRMTGGSTITQQTVKNMLVGNERSASRKIREAVLAQRLEQQFTKHQILELYMNEIYLGGRSYGVGAAALNYFGKSLSNLTLAECAMLASLPQAPSRVNPYNHPEAAVERRNWVLDRMAINGFITGEEAAAAQAEPLKTVSRLDSDEIQASAYYVEEVRREILRLGQDGRLDGFGSEEKATKAFYEGGLSIRTTLDTRMQLAAQTALQAGLETYDRRKGWRGPVGKLSAAEGWREALSEMKKPDGAGDWRLAVVLAVKGGLKVGLGDGEEGSLSADDVKWAAAHKRKEGGGSGLAVGDVILVSKAPAPDVTSQTIKEYSKAVGSAKSAWRLRQIPEVQGALVAMDPHTGRVLAMAGGYSFGLSQYNRAVQAKRQPGSSFKPFVYMAALDNGATPSTKVLDAPFVDCSDPTQEGCYKPSNYSEQFYGPSTLRVGIEKSRNAMTVRLAQDMGMEKVAEIGERAGIYDKLPPYLAMSLGAGETTPIRMVTAYAMLVNGGKQVEPILLDRIQNRYGATVFRRDGRTCADCEAEWNNQAPPDLGDNREQVLDPVTSYQIVSILEGVVERGTATSLRSLGRPLAGKTGTTNDFMDAWFIGFSPDLVAGVWVGFDQPKNLGEGESGGRLATPIFRDFMSVALENVSPTPFRRPAGVRLVEIDAETGCLPDFDTRTVITEAYRPGTEPTERCVTSAYGGDGFDAPRVDYAEVIPGDEGAYRRTDGEATPAPPTPAPGAEPSLNGEPPPPPRLREELTVRDGIF
ncbi:PBP1A family penicillin-binding protein [bacterium]|nr:PBP1A family penicillin-binding protein [bacterium]